MWEEWKNHPVVRYASESAGPEAPTLDVLTETMRLLHEIDERFPGVRMADVFAPAVDPPERTRVRAALARAGAKPEDIAIVAPSDADLAVSGLSHAELLQRYGKKVAARVEQYRSPPTDEDRELASAARRTSRRKAAAERRVSYRTVATAVVRCASEGAR